MTGFRFLALIAVSIMAGAGVPGISGAQSSYSSSPEQVIGFGDATTGSQCRGASCACIVTRLDDPPASVRGSIRSCAETGGRLTLFQARGAVELQRPLRIASDTTIDGRALRAGDMPMTLSGSTPWLMLIDGADNVIVRNLFFRVANRGDRCSDPQIPADTVRCGIPLYLRGDVRNVWIDHNDFDRCGEKCLTIWTGRMSMASTRAPAPDSVTISSNRFTNSYYGIAIGSTAALRDDQLPSAMRVTLYDNVFSNVFRRSPRAASNAEVHAFNNLVRHWGRPGLACRGQNYGFAASSAGKAQLLLENNVFEPWPGPDTCKLVAEAGDYAPKVGQERGLGYLRAAGNLLLADGRMQQQSPELVFNPATSYRYTLRPTAGLAAQLSQDAGVTGYPRPPLN